MREQNQIAIKRNGLWNKIKRGIFNFFAKRKQQQIEEIRDNSNCEKTTDSIDSKEEIMTLYNEIKVGKRSIEGLEKDTICKILTLLKAELDVADNKLQKKLEEVDIHLNNLKMYQKEIELQKNNS